MKKLSEYLINEELTDSFINIVKNIFSHGKVSNDKLFTIEIDFKVFEKLINDKKYFSQKNKEYPKLIPILYQKDFWELYSLEMNKNEYGDEEGTYTYIGDADFSDDGNIGEISVYKDYEDLVTKVFAKYK